MARSLRAAHEERFTRKKHDPNFPGTCHPLCARRSGHPIRRPVGDRVLRQAFIKFERLVKPITRSLPRASPVFFPLFRWIKEKLFMKKMLRDEFKNSAIRRSRYCSRNTTCRTPPAPLPESLRRRRHPPPSMVWGATTTIGHGTGNQIKMVEELHFRIRWVCSIRSLPTGFTVNSGEYKLMGLAPYGNPDSAQTKEFKRKTLGNAG